MMPALECYQRAAYCEGLARAADDETNRHMLVNLAQQWRQLGDETGAHSARIARSELSSHMMLRGMQATGMTQKA